MKGSAILKSRQKKTEFCFSTGVNPFFAVVILLSLAILPLRVEAARHRSRPANKKVESTTQASREPILRVKIGSTHSKLSLGFPEGGWMENSKGRRVKTFKKGETFNWALPGSSKKRRKIEYNGETMSFRGKTPLLELNKKPYRGFMQIAFTANGARAINHVGIEDYLRGVVGSEIGSLSPLESLKAQTVIARTYAYASRGKHGAEGADICDSTHCQVYSGVSAERATITPAVMGTRGIIMISEGEPIATLYHSCCGGMTSDNDKVFGGAPRSYLRRVVCQFCKDGSNYRWSRTIDTDDLKTALRKEKINFSRLYGVEVESPSYMDRANNVVFDTEKGSIRVKGTTFRRIFNLPSTTFVLNKRKLGGNMIASKSAISSMPGSRLAARKNTMIVTTLGDNKATGPQQMLVLTSRGIKRAQKPAGGWQTIACLAQEYSQTSEKSPQIPTRIEAGHTGRIGGGLDKIEIFGRGYGHQVGLCQSGAIELGKRSWSYRQILGLYYSNVALRSLDY
ncbi:MAG: SpoIID/LytB domain-containing protein [Erysipelotrichia bacterium]|nr:SpoIID/LytB domain-containing protein [Erysipelotrichia bacterium]